MTIPTPTTTAPADATPLPTLKAALTACDAAGVYLWASPPDRIRYRVSTATQATEQATAATDALRAAITDPATRAELYATLSTHPRPEPAQVPYVDRRLDAIWASSQSSSGLPGVYHDGRPYYRLTPSTMWYFQQQADKIYPSLDRQTTHALASHLIPLWGWIDRHYRPDQLARVEEIEQTLPPIPRGLWFHKSDTQ